MAKERDLLLTIFTNYIKMKKRFLEVFLNHFHAIS